MNSTARFGACPKKPVVGAIVPGGKAAAGDVTSVLEAGAIDFKAVVVRRSTAAMMGREMMRAIDSLRDDNPVALVIGYGGTNENGALDAVVDALAPELERPSRPMYVGLGHDEYKRTVDAVGVRWCTTPGFAPRYPTTSQAPDVSPKKRALPLKCVGGK
jgi:hypothetical protein